MAGRPTDYSDELIDRICQKIATSSKGLHFICKSEPDFPAFSTVFRWLKEEDKAAFKDKYARAREAQAEYLADEIIEIADDSRNDTQENEDGEEIVNHDHIQRAKLRVDTRKWKASKLYPKKYGEKVDINQHSTGETVIKVIYEDEINANDKTEEAAPGAGSNPE